MQGIRIIAALLATFLIGGPIASATGGGAFIGVMTAVAVYGLFPVIQVALMGPRVAAQQKESSSDEK